MHDLLIVAGEHSGDNHAATIVRTLKQRHPNLSIDAVGGAALQEAGAHLLFNLMPWSVVGLTEILKHGTDFMRLMRWLIEWVRAYQPTVICLVDFPGFNLRLAQRLDREKCTLNSGGKSRIFGYIAPQIWAWKARRRFTIARYMNHLAVIFPFEPECFKDTMLDVRFVGHPLLQQPNPFRYDRNGPLLLLPGSRLSAVKRIFPLLQTAFQRLQQQHTYLQAIVPYPNADIGNYLKAHIANASIAAQPLESFHTGVCGTLMSSGTASQQIALAGIPGIVAYRAHPLTFFLGKRLAKTPYLSMANILLGHPLYPEILQDTPHQSNAIAQQMADFLAHPEDTRHRFSEAAQALQKQLSIPPEQSAADWLETFF